MGGDHMKTLVTGLMLGLIFGALVQAAAPRLQLPDAMGRIEAIQPDGILVADQPFRVGGGTEIRDSTGMPQPLSWLRVGQRVDVFLYPAAGDTADPPTIRLIQERR